MGMVMEEPLTIVLDDVNIHAEDASGVPFQDFMASMTAMGLSQVISDPTHWPGHTLNLVFAPDGGRG